MQGRRWIGGSGGTSDILRDILASWPRIGMKMGIVGLVLSCCMFGCSSFNHEWDKAAARPAGGVEGAWAGRWESDAGHGGGALKCLLTKIGEEQYQARFYASYWMIFKFHTQVLLGAKWEGSQV